MIELVLGGARSGKSAFAEQQIRQLSQCEKVSYIATATAVDKEMKARIDKHQQDRASCEWQTVECPMLLADYLASADNQKVYLVECLSMWVNNLIYQCEQKKLSYEASDSYLTEQRNALMNTLTSKPLSVVIVSNEVGFGITPLGQSTRLFVDHLGWLNQAIAKVAGKVTLVCAGIPLTLKDTVHTENKDG